MSDACSVCVRACLSVCVCSLHGLRHLFVVVCVCVTSLLTVSVLFSSQYSYIYIFIFIYYTLLLFMTGVKSSLTDAILFHTLVLNGACRKYNKKTRVRSDKTKEGNSTYV